MSYVDLNPARAGIAKRLEQLPFTSIRVRIRSSCALSCALPPLENLSISLVEYRALLEWILASDAKVSSHRCDLTEALFGRLKYHADAWACVVQLHASKYRAYGSSLKLQAYAKALDQKRIRSGELR